ncbi:SHOCT domain-containing protein [Saccharicrinis sp. FJH62]|uniref:SHOCT domain-containing protein n=1 Tax=Saccharicrinis sp. FJH62 TaxID=3344657 RepID=UPI0035D4EAD4
MVTKTEVKMYGFNGMHWGMGYGWMAGIILMFVLAWIIFRVIEPEMYPNIKRRKSALDILKERYAKGEIGTSEYEKKSELIKDQSK